MRPSMKTKSERRPGSRVALLTWAFAFLLGSGTAAQAAGPDCPQARQPYSVDMVLFDILLEPAAKVAVETVAPGLFGRIPPFFLSRTPPSFATILTLRAAAADAGLPAQDIIRVNAALSRVPVTPMASAHRCARYDPDIGGGKAVVQPAPKRPAILLFDKINGFRDQPSVRAAEAAFRDIAMRRGWTIVTSASGTVFNPRDLQKFNAVIWNNVSGDALTIRQRRAFRRYIETGGGFIGIHGSGGDPFVPWDWYRDQLIGVGFKGHPMSPQFQEAKINVDDPNDPIVTGLGADWSMTDEWYSFASNPRSNGAHILLTLDERSYNPSGFGGDLHMGDHPIARARCIGKG